jgi:histidinol-phosphatase
MNPIPSRSDDLRLGLELADLADEVCHRYFRSEGLVVETKPDLSPVSRADREAEEAIRRRIERERPGDGVVGEEFGVTAGTGSRRWILDPIDGTRKFVRGIPIFGALIALEEEGVITVGVASAPLLGRRWWAARRLGAFADGRPIQVSRIAKLADANLLHGGLEGFVLRERGPALLDLAARSWATAGYGDLWIHLLVAEGAAEAAIEPQAAIWDIAPLKVIVEEAGGRCTDWSGNGALADGTALSTNGLVHEEMLDALGWR